MAKKELPAEGMVNGKKVRGKRRYQMIDNNMINGLHEDTKRKKNAGTDEEEEKILAGPLAKKELPAEGCSRWNDKREESSR